ncbi:MAG: hypothetical protein SVX28_01815 [Pseudomonadota bacterium]|nr:hypothetical protein [Pseudomonadota bacterium]
MNEPLPDLVASFRIRRGLFRRETVEAGLFELDDYGCVLKSDKVFEPGDTLVFDLVMDMPFDDIRAEGLKGLVTERRKHCSNFFYSIDFKTDSSEKDPLIADKLRRIREVLDKKQSLRSRRGSGGSLSGMREMA